MAFSPDPEISFIGEQDEEQNESGQGDAVHDNQIEDEFSDAVQRDEMTPDKTDGFHDTEEYDVLKGRNGRDGPHSKKLMAMIGGYPGSVSGRFYMKPDHFSGDEDWDEYISHFESCAKLGKWSQEEKVLTLAACLRGVARTFYVSLTITETSSYSILIKKLQQRFGNSQPQSKWLALLDSRARKSDESIVALGGDLRQLAQKAYSNLDAKSQEMLALNQLFRVLPYEMKCRCIDKECKTVAEAVEVVQRYESLLGDEVTKKKSSVRLTNGSSFSDSKIIDSVQETLKQVVDRLDRLERKGLNPFGPDRSTNYQQGNKACFLCKSTDHFYRKCPFYNKSKAENGGYRRDLRNRDVLANDNKFNQQKQGNEFPLAV